MSLFNAAICFTLYCILSEIYAMLFVIISSFFFLVRFKTPYLCSIVDLLILSTNIFVVA